MSWALTNVLIAIVAMGMEDSPKANVLNSLITANAHEHIVIPDITVDVNVAKANAAPLTLKDVVVRVAEKSSIMLLIRPV